MSEAFDEMMKNAAPDSVLGHMREMKRLADEINKLKPPSKLDVPVKQENEHAK